MYSSQNSHPHRPPALCCQASLWAHQPPPMISLRWRYKKKKKKCEHRVCIRERHSLQVWKVNPVWKTIKHAFFVLPDWSYYFCFFVLYLFTKVIFCIFHIFWHIWLLVVDVGLLMPWQCVYDIGLWLKIWVNSFGDCLTFSQEVHKSGWNKKLPNVLPWHLF